MKMGTVAIAVAFQKDQPVLLDQFSDDSEIATLEKALVHGEQDPLQAVYRYREERQQEDEEFGDYVEELISQPAVRSEIQEHGVRWLTSKLKIEQFSKSEREASQVIAEFAFKLFRQEPNRRDFVIAGPAAKVRIRVLVVSELERRNAA